MPVLLQGGWFLQLRWGKCVSWGRSRWITISPSVASTHLLTPDFKQLLICCSLCSIPSLLLPSHRVRVRVWVRRIFVCVNSAFSYIIPPSASTEQVELNEPHAPRENAIEAFNKVLDRIKFEVIKSRRHWDQHEPKMWSRASGLTDDDLTNFTIENDLVLVRLHHPLTWIHLINQCDVSDSGCVVLPFFIDIMPPLHVCRSGVGQLHTGPLSSGRSESL